MQQDNLFQGSTRPLSYRARPIMFEEFVGQEHIVNLVRAHSGNLILWGPTGTGKTTLARLTAISSGRNFYPFSACLGTLSDLKALMAQAREDSGSILFIDEIHRANRIQQDALLPYAEEGLFTLMGATTENPRAVLSPALLSRVKVFELKKLSAHHLVSILYSASKKSELIVEDKLLQDISHHADGDARRAINMLEELIQGNGSLEYHRQYDRKGERHYDVISAFIKSLRGSDPNSALLWLAVMLDGGEDPGFYCPALGSFCQRRCGQCGSRRPDTGGLLSECGGKNRNAGSTH